MTPFKPLSGLQDIPVATREESGVFSFPSREPGVSGTFGVRRSDTAYQAPLSMGFPRQGYWSGLPFPFPGNLLDPGMESRSPALQADSLPSEPPGKPFFLICKMEVKILTTIVPQNRVGEMNSVHERTLT